MKIPTPSRPVAGPRTAQAEPVARAAFVKFMAASRYLGVIDVDDVCQKLFADDATTLAIVKANQTVGSTSGWGSSLVASSMSAFLASLTPDSAAAALMRNGLNVNLDGHSSMLLPKRSTVPATIGATAEGDPIPVRNYSFDQATLGPSAKLAVLSIFSRQLARRGNGRAVVEKVIKEDAALSIDAIYFSTATGGLLNGVSAIAGYSGGDIQAAEVDLKALLTAVATGGSGNDIALITSPSRAIIIDLMFPNWKFPIIASAAVADNRIIAVDQAALAHATGEPSIDASAEAIVHMSDVPLEIVSDTGPTTADPVRSLWQTDSIGIRMICDVAVVSRRSGAAQYVDNVTW
jgi:hypothetical protein